MLLNGSRRCNCLVIFYVIFFKFSIWCYLVHVSSLLTYIHYISNIGGRHRWLLLSGRPSLTCIILKFDLCLFVINKFFFFFFFFFFSRKLSSSICISRVSPVTSSRLYHYARLHATCCQATTLFNETLDLESLCPLKWPSRFFKVITSGAFRQISHSFLLNFPW